LFPPLDRTGFAGLKATPKKFLHDAIASVCGLETPIEASPKLSRYFMIQNMDLLSLNRVNSLKLFLLNKLSCGCGLSSAIEAAKGWFSSSFSRLLPIIP
jgi:hypothetical protein